MSKTVKEFLGLLRCRFDASVLTTEDGVRYTFFAALLQNGFRPEQVVLEHLHPSIPGARIDTVILGGDQSPKIVIEFKYHRANPGGTNQPMPQKAGAIFSDLVRLLKLPWQVSRYLVYVTDRELADYLANPRNRLSEVFGLREGGMLKLGSDFFKGRSATFLDSMGDWPGPAKLYSMAAADLPEDHFLRVYEIELSNAS